MFEAEDEEAYIESVKEEITEQFKTVNVSSYYFIKKSVRRILRITRKYIRYSGKKETEVTLLLFFCSELKNMKPSYTRNVALVNLLGRQMDAIRKALSTLHEDLQFDYRDALHELDDGMI